MLEFPVNPINSDSMSFGAINPDKPDVYNQNF
jgi:hypothetical protein